MDEKDRIITAIYNDTRARARSVPALSCPLSTVLAPPSRVPVPTTRLLSPAGPTEPGSSRSTGRGSSCSRHLGLPQARGSRPRAPAPEAHPWMGPPGRPLPGLPTPRNACNKMILRARVRLPPSGPAPPARASPPDAPRPPGSGGSDPGAQPPGRRVPFPPQPREGVCGGGGPRRRPRPPSPAPRPGGERVSGSHEPPARQPGPGPPPSPPSPPSPPPPPAAATGRPPARLLRPPPLRCAALPAPRAREGAAEEPPPAPGPRPPRPGPRHGALAAAAPRAARLGRCGRPRRAAPAGTMSPLLRRLLLAALLQLAPAQVRASPPARQPCPLSRLAEVGRRGAAAAGGPAGSGRALGRRGDPARASHGRCPSPPAASPAPGPLPRPTPSPGRSRGRGRVGARRTWFGSHCAPCRLRPPPGWESDATRRARLADRC